MCFPHPCNSGSCRILDDGHFRCDCPWEWTGNLCDRNATAPSKGSQSEDERKNFADSSANASAHVRAHIHEAEDLERQLENLETLSKLRKGERKTSKLEKEKEEKNKGKKIRQEKGMKVEKKVDVEEKV